MNHSCDPNTFRFTIGDLFILIAMRNIKKNEEVCTIYFSMEKSYEERQKKAKNQFGFTCECEYCKNELEAIKTSEIKRECEKLKNILKNYRGQFPYSEEYKKIKNFIHKNKKQLHHFDLWTLTIDFDELAREDMTTLKDCAELFEDIFDIMRENDFFNSLYCAQNLAAIYYDMNKYQKCKESYEKMESIMNEGGKQVLSGNMDVDWVVKGLINQEMRMRGTTDQINVRIAMLRAQGKKSKEISDMLALEGIELSDSGVRKKNGWTNYQQYVTSD